MIPNKKTRAYSAILLSILATWFIEFKQVEFFGFDAFSIVLQYVFSVIFCFAFAAGLIYTFNKIAEYYE